jgi:hypothetical protein
VPDIVDLEGRGLVGVFVASAEFVDAAAAQATASGYEPTADFVSHPIQDRIDAEMRELADGAVEEVLAAIQEP